MTHPTHYVPDRDDLVWLSFTPQAGHEQAGRRPALVVSRKSYNGKVGLPPMDMDGHLGGGGRPPRRPVSGTCMLLFA